MAVGGLARPSHAGDGQCGTLRVLTTLAVRPRRSQGLAVVLADCTAFLIAGELGYAWPPRDLRSVSTSLAGEHDPCSARRRDLLQPDYRSFPHRS
jgi:hypothetical protein